MPDVLHYLQDALCAPGFYMLTSVFAFRELISDPCARLTLEAVFVLGTLGVESGTWIPRQLCNGLSNKSPRSEPASRGPRVLPKH